MKLLLHRFIFRFNGFNFYKKIISAFFVFSFFASTTISVYAGNGNPHGGARDAGVAGASLTFGDAFSMFNNVAGMAWQQGFRAGLYNETRYGLKELSTNGLSVSYGNTKSGSVGLGIKYFGYNQYNEQDISFGYARLLSTKISGGIQFHFLKTNFGDAYYGDKSTLTVSLGMQYKVTEKLQFAFNIFNPTRNQLANYNNERFPTIVKAGFCWKPNEKVMLCVEDEKSVQGKNIIKGGIEYHITKPLYLRTGIAGTPANGSFGLGLELKKFKIDIAANYHPVLGVTPHFSLLANL